MQQHPADAAGPGRGYLESRIATQDGYIWPFERQRMVSAGAIRERMVEDIKALVHDGGEEAVVALADLLAKGWSSPQVMAHGAIAFQMHRAAEQAQGRVGLTGPDHPLRVAGEAAALALFTFATLLWAGIGTEAI